MSHASPMRYPACPPLTAPPPSSCRTRCVSTWHHDCLPAQALPRCAQHCHFHLLPPLHPFHCPLLFPPLKRTRLRMTYTVLERVILFEPCALDSCQIPINGFSIHMTLSHQQVEELEGHLATLRTDIWPVRDLLATAATARARLGSSAYVSGRSSGSVGGGDSGGSGSGGPWLRWQGEAVQHRSSISWTERSAAAAGQRQRGSAPGGPRPRRRGDSDQTG